MNQKEFEDLIKQVIAGEISRREISDKYKIAMRTINKKITELAVNNPTLYEEFISKYPFQPKEITHIDFKQLVKSIIKYDVQLQQFAILYGISPRTLNRKITKMKNSDIVDELTGMKESDIYSLYLKYRKKDLSFEDMKVIDKMKVGEIKIFNERSDYRRKYLENLICEYNKLISKGNSKAEAARQLGFCYTDMCKKEEELKRILTEEKTRNFKEQLKVDVQPSIISKKTSTQNNPYKEPKVKGE